jgi:hypothetical protein
MSSQAKKRFNELKAYLGKDVKGLELLKLYKDDVNVLRKNLAAAAARAAEEEVVKNAARERAAAAECEVTQLRLEVYKLTQQVANLARELAAATKPQETEVQPADVDPVVSISEAELYAVFNNIRKEHPGCPAPYNDRRVDPDGLPGFYREELAKGWSQHSLWTVGAVVSFIVAIRGGLILRSHKTFPFLHDREVMQKLSKRVAAWYLATRDGDNDDAALETVAGVAGNVENARKGVLKKLISGLGLEDT